MRFYLAAQEEALHPGPFGILEPGPDPGRLVETSAAGSLCVVPGLCMGRDGSRIGYGGGYYDRFLARYRGVTVGVCYDAVLFDSLPQTAEDRRLRWIATERSMSACGGQK